MLSSDSFQEKLMKMIHVDIGHRGVEEIYSHFLNRFWWLSLKKKVKIWVKSCEPFQKRDYLVPREIHNPTGEIS